MGKKLKIVVVGGSAAGPKAAARARRLDQEAEITIVQKGPDLSMASCGYPYYVGGFFDNRNLLLCTPTGVVRDPKFFMNAKNVQAKTNSEVTAIDRQKREVLYKDLESGETESLAYDKLILATGAVPRMPPVTGVDLEGITTLQSMADADFLRNIRDEGKIKKAVIIGGGLIGIETCEALQLAGIKITVIELLPQILTFLDWQLAKILENFLKTKADDVITENGVVAFLGDNGKITGVKLANGSEIPCELAVVAVGVRPNTRLAAEAGLAIGNLGGVKVNEYMQTSDPDIYAVGDLVEVRHRITGRNVLAPYGDLANLQGRVAGENAVLNNRAVFPGTIQSGVCKVFDYTAGSTGLSEASAGKLGYDTVSVVTAGPDKPGFMNGKVLINKMVADAKTRKILGFQCIGLGDASKQIAEVAIAIQGELSVDDLVNADLPYAPPFSLAIDNVISVAHVLQNKLDNRMAGISAMAVKEKLDRGEKPFLLDARGPDEYEIMRLGIGENLIPLGALRKRLDELPADKNREIICYCKISLRGYEAARILESEGWRNVKVMEGGILAWPFKREK